MASRDGAVARALAFFDGNGFRDRLADLVAVPSTSQDPGHEADVQRYLEGAIRPWLQRLGFDSLGLDRPVVVGFSLGGSTALGYAIDHPDAYASLACDVRDEGAVFAGVLSAREPWLWE